MHREPTMPQVQHIRVPDYLRNGSGIYNFVEFMIRRARLGTPLKSFHLSLVVNIYEHYKPIDAHYLKKLKEVKVRDEVVFKLRVLRWEFGTWPPTTMDLSDEPEKWSKKDQELGVILKQLRGKMLSQKAT